MRRLLGLLAACLACFVMPAFAAPSTTTTTVARPALPQQDRPVLLAAIDGQPLAIDRDGQHAWLLAARGWSAVEIPHLDAPLVAAVSDGRNAILLGGAAGKASPVTQLVRTGTGIAARALPSLPPGLTAITATATPDALLVAALASDGTPRLLRLTLSDPGAWHALAAWPGGTPAALGAQNGGIFVTLADGRQWRWLTATGWRAGAPAPGRIVSGTPRAIGQAYLLYLVTNAGGTRLYSYSAITDAWAPLGNPLGATPVAATSQGDGLLAAAPSGNGLAFSTLTLSTTRQSVAMIDWLIIAAYLFAMLGIGLTFYRRAKRGPSAEFFLGSRAIPAWAAGISMFAGSISSISYLAVPAKAFETNWD